MSNDNNKASNAVASNINLFKLPIIGSKLYLMLMHFIKVPNVQKTLSEMKEMVLQKCFASEQ